MTRVVFALERNAKTDPPEDGLQLVPTNVEVGKMTTHTWKGKVERWWLTASGSKMHPQPSVWYDLRPTEGEGLTVEDLEDLADHVLSQSDPMYWEAERAIATRLRAALDALTRKDTP